jgi:hypothetical protein
VLGLVDENTAAGVHYGIDRVFENKTHVMVLYNMGSEATQVRGRGGAGASGASLRFRGTQS